MQIEIETCKRTSIQKQRAENQTTKKKKKILRSPRRCGSPRMREEGGKEMMERNLGQMLVDGEK